MSNTFAEAPVLAEGFPLVKDKWVCPYTGLVVPKDPVKNLEWRAKILEMAEEDSDLQQDLFTAASQSILFFVNAFCFTLRVFEPGEDGEVQQAENKHLPYVTWDIQDKHLLWIEHKMDAGEEGLTDKSRDMGATWNHIAVYVHRLLFRPDESHLLISRKEDAVDQLDGLPKNYPFGTLSNPGTLFGKIDYILSRLPEWMLPRLGRKKLHVVNLDNGTRIDGESANASAGSSDRRTSIFLDEMAKMKEAEAIKRSTKDVTACRLPCSTPNGAGTSYSQWRLSGQIEVFVLPWWEHPEKGRDRYTAKDDLGRWKIRSPWYDAEDAVRSPKEMAIEIDMDHVGSGDLYFEANIIEQHRKLHGRPPSREMTVKFRKNVPDGEVQNLLAKRDLSQVYRAPRGPLKWWGELVNGRPDQRVPYAVCCDISKGQGASNSTITIVNMTTKEKVGAYADATVPPYEFARIVCAVCLWVGGSTKHPLLIWENNGDPGYDFGQQIVHTFYYPNIYFDRAAGTQAQKVGKRFGWRSSPEKKSIALGLLRRAYAHGGFINHDEESLTEATSYINYQGGGIGPAALVNESDSARKTHGDRVIADMLACVATQGPVRFSRPVQATPERSPAHRFKQWKRDKMSRNRPGKTFDFRSAS